MNRRDLTAIPPIDSRNVATETQALPLRVTLARGNLNLSREICDTFLSGIESVALLERDGRVLNFSRSFSRKFS